MEQEINKHTEFKEKFIQFLKKNKNKLFIFLFIIIISSLTIFFLNLYDKKKNILASEKYIQAGLFLTHGKSEKSKKIYEEIILSKNKFYSILALNTILENNLEPDKNIVLNYFEVLEKLDISSDQKDLIKFKKALFLIDNSKIEEGNRLLKNLIDSDSKLKKIAEEIILK